MVQCRKSVIQVRKPAIVCPDFWIKAVFLEAYINTQKRYIIFTIISFERVRKIESKQANKGYM